MTKLQTIENALITINETLFQELCDSFLLRKNSNYAAFSRTGSQSGKQKTIKGTPDTFLLLPNGKYIFVEYSTNITSGLKKLREDLEKCLNFTKTSIATTHIEEIIICINFNLKTSDIQSLNSVIENTNISLTVYTLDAIALELHLHHRDLAHQYLDIALDTGQVVTINKFIKEYNKASKGIATPLDNIFTRRENELSSLKNDLIEHDFIILTGIPGVGKTKLALESITQYCLENPSFIPYCISYKHYTLLDDLYQYFDNNGDYILFVDDANRIDAFNQILGFYKTPRKGSLKIIVTVRDYAYNEFQLLCSQLSLKRIYLEKFKDEDITEIISSEPFNIKNVQYQEIIVNIADGNPRIAIMASLLAIANQNIQVLQNVSELFESYFATFVMDEGDFTKKLNMQCLGLIAFFYTIPYKDKDTTTSILNHFDLDYESFIHSIDNLDRLELVEIQFNHVKIPEQNLATYFFYKCFIKEKLLSFETLLKTYFLSNQNRFKDSVVSANNTFGHNNVMEKLKPYLQRYLYKFKDSDPKEKLQFISTFWFYLQNETLEFIFETINSLPHSEVTDYKVDYNTNDFVYNQNPLINLLSNFYRVLNNHLKDALELGFLYAKKKPEDLPELIYKIAENLIFDRDDELTDFSRQNILFNILIEKLQNKEPIYAAAFFGLSKKFLHFEFQHSRGGRNSTIHFYHYRIPNKLIMNNFRRKIWKTVDGSFDLYPELAFDLLKSYSQPHPDVANVIMAFEIPQIILIIEKHLDANSFLHCKYVHDQIRWFKRNSIEMESFSSLVKKFTNQTYKTFLKLDWDRFRDKEMFDFENHQEYDDLKQQEIRASFVFNKVNEVENFYKNFVYLKNNADNDYNYNTAFDLVVDENCSRNFELGCQLLDQVIQHNNEINYVPRTVFNNQLKVHNSSDLIWKLIKKQKFNHRSSWELSFYDNIDKSLINEQYVNEIINTVREINEPITIYFNELQKFLDINPKLFQILLRIIYKKNNSEKKSIKLWFNFFENHFNHINNDLSLVKKTYLQQDKLQKNFDYGGKAFLLILTKSPSFLVDYINYLYEGCEYRIEDTHRNLNFIWKIDNIESNLEEALNLISEKELYLGVGKHFCNNFFKNLTGIDKSKAENFIRKYCSDNYLNTKRMNIIMDVVRHSLNHLLEEIIISFLKQTQDEKIFSKIYWRGNGGTVHVGEVIFGDLEAAEWRNILSIVEKSSAGISLLPIKRQINENIDSALAYADWERRRRFLE